MPTPGASLPAVFASPLAPFAAFVVLPRFNNCFAFALLGYFPFIIFCPSLSPRFAVF